MGVLIPDISHHRPVKDWSKIKGSCSFLISKATQGTSFIDSTLDSFIKGCEINKIPYWLYTYLNKGNEKAQAEFMVKTCKSRVGKYFVGYILDVEAGNTTSGVKSALDYLKGLNVKTMIYTMYAEYNTYKSVINGRGNNCAWWEARYGLNNGSYSSKYPPHSGVDLHQYTDVGTCSGISGKCDLNRISGTKNESWFKSAIDNKKDGDKVTVKIGSARINEKGTVTGGKAGDQTGGEVSTQNWYLHKKGWVVIRPKSSTVAEKIAKCMEMACANDNIGYCQTHRDDLREESKQYKYDVSKVKKKLEVDCSALVRVCCLYAGVNVIDFNTTFEITALEVTGEFDIITDKSVCESSDKLKRGDILVTKTKGHTVVVLTNGTGAGTVVNNTNKGGTYKVEFGLLKKGTKSKLVNTFELCMKAKGYYTGKIDGEYGAKCEEACKKLQKDKMGSKEADGKCGKNTWPYVLGHK